MMDKWALRSRVATMRQRLTKARPELIIIDGDVALSDSEIESLFFDLLRSLPTPGVDVELVTSDFTDDDIKFYVKFCKKEGDNKIALMLEELLDRRHPSNTQPGGLDVDKRLKILAEFTARAINTTLRPVDPVIGALPSVLSLARRLQIIDNADRYYCWMVALAGEFLTTPPTTKDNTEEGFPDGICPSETNCDSD